MEHSTPDRPVTIMLADDHALMRRALRILPDAENGFDVVAEVGTISKLSTISPKTAVVVLTMEQDPVYMR